MSAGDDEESEATDGGESEVTDGGESDPTGDVSPVAAARARLSRFGDPVLLAVVGVALLALVARLVLLGDRIAHWDEARVAWWILEYAETGQYYYRPIVHGPFLQHVNRYVFGAVGATDATMRLVPAVVGGLLPLSALLLRARLRGSEVVALALFLAADPVLLYYARFMRGDLLVGAFAFAAFALLVRGIDTGGSWYVLPASLLVALSFTVKENAVLYLLCWLGAAALLLDHRLVLARRRERHWVAVAVERGRWALGGLRRSVLAIAGGVLGFLVTVVLFYAPRGDPPTGDRFYGPYCAASHARLVDFSQVVGLERALANPGKLPVVVEAATVGSGEVLACQWVGGAVEGSGSYLVFLGDLLQTMGYGAGALSMLAIVGFLVDRYGGDAPRDLPAFAFYWGFASLLGYPLVSDISAPWAAVHVVLPLSIPAAVGLALLYREGRAALADDDRPSVALVAVLLLLVVGQVAGVGLWTVYLHPQANTELAQYAQPAGDLRPTLEDTEALARTNGETATDVLLYGSFFTENDAEALRRPACARWFNLLPLPWYFERAGMRVDCARTNASLEQSLADEDPPPVVVTHADNASAVRERLPPGYEERTHLLRLWDTPTTFFVDASRLPGEEARVDRASVDAEGRPVGDELAPPRRNLLAAPATRTG